MPARRLLPALWLLAACATTTPPLTALTPPPEAPPMLMTPAPNHPFVTGPSTSDVASLTHWLEGQVEDGRPLVVRLPIEVQLAPGRGAVRGGRLLTTSSEATPVTLDDTALGVSLADRARQACPDLDLCPLWLEGHWQKDGLRVTRAGRPLSAAELKAPLFAGLEVPGARPELVALIDALASGVPMPEKYEAGRALVAAGKDAIPVLIAALGDDRAYQVHDLANRMNLPYNARVEVQLATMTVGSRCLELLHSVVTPSASSPAPGNFKVYSQQILSVKDWRAFWASRKAKSLEELHAELRPLVTKYWEQHGTTQPVP